MSNGHRVARVTIPTARRRSRSPTASDELSHHEREERETLQRFEQHHVHAVYDAIANSFSDTRYKPWPRVAAFLDDAADGSVVIDVGCGNAKNLRGSKCLHNAFSDAVYRKPKRGVEVATVAASSEDVDGRPERHLLELGCDMSRGLLDIARRRGHEVAQCDIAAPALPYRAGCADRVLCIAVLHHVATHERRAHALAAMARLLRPGCGARLLLYVWSTQFAVTQVQRGRADPSILEGITAPPAAQSSESTATATTTECAAAKSSAVTAGADMLVGFTERTQSGEAKGVHSRFYHLSTRDELASLCATLGPEYRTREIWYDCENWAADVERL